MWVVIAIVASIVVIVLLVLLQTIHRKTKQRRALALASRPVHPAGDNFSIGVWKASCMKSLNWSRKRRNKEVN